MQKRIGKGGSTSQVFPPKDKLQEEALIAVKFHTLHASLVISRLLRSSPRHPIPLQLFSSSPHGSPSAQPHPSRIESTRLNSCKALSSCLELLAARSAAAYDGGLLDNPKDMTHCHSPAVEPWHLHHWPQVGMAPWGFTMVAMGPTPGWEGAAICNQVSSAMSDLLNSELLGSQFDT